MCMKKIGITAGILCLTGAAFYAAEHLKKSWFKRGFKHGEKFAFEQTSETVKECNDCLEIAVEKYNSLVGRYNSLFDEHNKACERLDNLLSRTENAEKTE